VADEESAANLTRSITEHLLHSDSGRQRFVVETLIGLPHNCNFVGDTDDVKAVVTMAALGQSLPTQVMLCLDVLNTVDHFSRLSSEYLQRIWSEYGSSLKKMATQDDNDEELRELRLEVNLLEKHALSQASGPQKSAALQRMSSAVQKAKTQGLAVRRKSGTGRAQERFDEKCYHCHGIGHWKSECPYAEFLPDVAKEKARSDTVFVGGLENKSESDKIEDQEKLEEIFSEFGVVLAVTLRERREDGRVSWALVTYAKPEQAQMAIAKGKEMDVSKQPIWCNSFDLPVALKSGGSMRKIATAHSAKLSASKRRPRMQTMMPTGSSPQGPKAVRFE
jgi:hypothetical protein